MTFGRRDDRISIFGTLRPGPGQMVSRAIVTTYSLDLVAMLGLVLALGSDVEVEFEASPLGLVKAFDKLRGKLLVLHQLSRVMAPSAHRSVLPLLDTMVHAIPSNEREESWHPKTALVRYEAEGGVEWRFWIGSRNLTGSTDRDAGMLLVTSKERAAKPIPDIARLAEDLMEEARLTPTELSELRSTRWMAPPGMSVRNILWRRNGQTRRFIDTALLPRADRSCAVSPFIDHGGLAEVLKAGARSIALLTTEIAGADCAPHDGVNFRVDAAPEPEATVSVEQQQEEADGEFNEPPSTGIHAKLLAVSKGQRTALLLGSANLTKRGLVGPNAEAVAILDITDPALADSIYGFVDSGIELATIEVDTTQERENARAQRELDGLISQFLECSFILAYKDDGLHLIVGDGTGHVLGLAHFEVSPFLDADAWTSIQGSSRSIRLLANPPPVSEQTSLVNFRARSLTDPEVSRSWVQALDAEGIDVERRDRVLLARYVGANRFRDWLRSLLDGVDGTGGQRWSDAVGTSPRQDPSGRLAQIFTLETMLAAWARDHKAFESRVGGMMVMLESFGEVFATIPDDEEREAALNDLEEVRPFLQAVHDAIGVAA
ncbi:phospholipase D family protein [Mesorhizobium comanense]|uniref:phospholipase D family protein n=1 Tax=Mesorhizobium comanense TaxID=2502215 RepID=UPI0010F98020|nr:phospholipase D family protein [Mesorhizobium comanense]